MFGKQLQPKGPHGNARNPHRPGKGRRTGGPRPARRPRLRPRHRHVHRGRRRHRRRPHRRRRRSLRGPAGHRRGGPHPRAGVHRHAPSYRKLPRHALRVRPLRPSPRRDDRDLRSPRDRQRHRRRRHPLFPGGERRDAHGHPGAAFLLRALDRHGDLGGDPHRRRPRRAHGPPLGHRPCGVHELPRRHPPRPRGHGQAQALRGRPCRRALPAAFGPRPQRLYRRRHPHRARGDHRRRGAREAQEGHARAHP